MVSTAFISLATIGAGTAVVRAPRLAAPRLGVLGTLWVATALLYPALQRLSRVVRRYGAPASARLTRCASSLGVISSDHDDVYGLLDDVCAPAAAGVERAGG